METNPVLRKDLLGLLRLKRVAAVQIFFAAVLGLLVLATWPQTGIVSGTLEVASAQAAASDQLLPGLVLIQIVLLALFVPGTAAVALTGEKEGNTLEMLYASRLSAGQIIWGKVGLAVAYPLLLLVSGLPFAALLGWRGDVRMHELLWSYAVLAVAAVYLALLSLAVSAIARQTATAMVVSYALVLVLCGVVLVPAAIMLESQSGTIAEVLHYSRALSPVAAAISLLRPEFHDTGGTIHGLRPLWPIFLVAATAVSAICFLIIGLLLRRTPGTAEGWGNGSAANAQRTTLRKVMFLIDPKKQRPPLGGGNPIIGKERRTSSLRSGQWMIRIFYGSLFLSLGLAVMSLYGGAEHADLLKYVVQVLVALQLGLIGLVVPSLTTAAISSELENGTWEVLRLAPLKPGQIFWGKLIPALIPAMLPLIALAPAYAAMCFVNPGYVVRMLNIAPIIVMASIFACFVGLTASALISSTARATVAAYMTTAVIFIVPLLGWALAGDLINIRVARWIAFVSPLVMSLNAIAESAPQIDALRSEHIWLMVALCLAMLIIARVRLSALLRRGL